MRFIELIQKLLIIFSRKSNLPLKYHHEMCMAKNEPKKLIKMRMFECVESDFRIVGLNQSRQEYPFNMRILVILFIFVCGIISDIVFLLSETKTFEEFNSSLYEISSAFVVATSFTIFTWNMRKLFHFINCLEEIVNKSKLRRLEFLLVLSHIYSIFLL